ncbi:MAG: transposase family protein, partial [Deltaproteobacteria bacterium]|nr:transposase family protein [Deltaproteobacteria bacterium]
KCPYCGSENLYKHGMYEPRQVLHTWTNGTKIYLDLHRRRWKCRDCGHTFIESKELVRSRSRLTRQAEAEALWQLPMRSRGEAMEKSRPVRFLLYIDLVAGGGHN